MYWLITHIRPDGLDARSLRGFRVINAAKMPGLEIDGDVWARANLRLLIDEETTGQLSLIWNKAGCLKLEEYKVIESAVLKLVDPSLHSFILPGVQFGIPRLEVKSEIWFDLLNDFISQRFVDHCEENQITGISWKEMELIKGAKFSKGKLFCLDAGFSELDEASFSQFTTENEKYKKPVLPELKQMKIKHGKADIYKMPYMYGGYIVSDRFKEMMEKYNLNLGVVFSEIVSGD